MQETRVDSVVARPFFFRGDVCGDSLERNNRNFQSSSFIDVSRERVPTAMREKELHG